MTRFIHDQFAKDYLEELLKRFGKVESSTRVAGEVREIDVLFSPLTPQSADLETLGLLGKLATTLAIFEPFRNPATTEEVCDCLLKLLEVRGAIQREGKRNKTPLTQIQIPKLWILTPTASKGRLSGFCATEKPDWLKGVYFLPPLLRTAIIVIHKLPPTPETLWLRLLGRGKVQKQAIDELETLPANHPFQRATLELLYNLQQNLEINQSSETEDRELIMRLAPLYQQDRERARQEGEERIIIRQLHRRFGEIKSSLIEQIQSLSVEQLEILGEALLDFKAVTDLEAWLTQH